MFHFKKGSLVHIRAEREMVRPHSSHSEDCHSKVESSKGITNTPSAQAVLLHTPPEPWDQAMLSHRQQSTAKVAQDAQSQN